MMSYIVKCRLPVIIKCLNVCIQLMYEKEYAIVKLDDESKLPTTFNTPYGRYCLRRFPFGLVSAQDVFQKKVDQIFEGLPGVVAIADGIVVIGKTETEHDKHLDNVMRCTQQAGLCLNPDKCVVKSRRIKFFGNYLSSNGLEPDPSKIAAIADMSPPTSAQELQSLSYVERYMQDRASFHKREKWQQQYNQHTRSLKELHRAQSVRVQDHVTKKLEPAIVKQKVGEPRSYLVTTKSGAEYRRNRRHIRTTGETFRLPDRCHSDENTDGEHEAVNPAEPVTCEEQSQGNESSHVVGQACAYIGDAPYKTRAGRSVQPPNRLDV